MDKSNCCAVSFMNHVQAVPFVYFIKLTIKISQTSIIHEPLRLTPYWRVHCFIYDFAKLCGSMGVWYFLLLFLHFDVILHSGCFMWVRGHWPAASLWIVNYLWELSQICLLLLLTVNFYPVDQYSGAIRVVGLQVLPSLIVLLTKPDLTSDLQPPLL